MIQSVDRAVRILLELQGARQLGLAELAARLELPSSTVHGLVKTLTIDGMVEQDSAGRYTLGPRVLGLGNVYLDSNEFRLRSLNAAESLSSRTGHAVRLGVLLGSDVVVVHHVLRPDGSRQMSEVGISIPAHATALGKAVLAFTPAALADLAVEAALPRLTGRTLSTIAALQKALDPVRLEGMAQARDEVIIGEMELAAAVFDAKSHAVGAIGLVLPSNDEPLSAALSAAVREAAVSISRSMGASTWPAVRGQDSKTRLNRANSAKERKRPA